MRTSTFRLALTMALLASASALSQSGIAGLNGGLPPKLLIIFDTSNSMRNLPDYDPNSGQTIPDFPPRGLNYLNDDWDPSTPTAPCDNRFCIGKRTLTQVLPGYSDSLQLGLAGYFQYRSRFVSAGGQTQCVYDVLAGTGTPYTFRSNTSGLGGTSVVPPRQQAICAASTAALHTYPITLQATIPGAPLQCNLYRSDVPATATPGANQLLEGIGPGASGCADWPTVSFTRGTPLRQRSGGMTDDTSNLFVRRDRGLTCPTTGSLLFQTNGLSDGNADSFVTPTPFSVRVDGNRGLYRLNGGGFEDVRPSRRTGTHAWLANCLPGPNSNHARRCRLEAVPSGMVSLGNETSTVHIWRSRHGTPFSAPAAGFSFTEAAPARTYTYDTGSFTTFNMTRAPTAGTCQWHDGAMVTGPSETRIITTTGGLPGGFTSAPSANCRTDSPNNGCEVQFVNQNATGSQPGAWTPSSLPVRYTRSAPSNGSATCSGTGLQSIPYTNTGTQTNVTVSRMAFGSLAAACPAQPDSTDGTIGGRSLSWTSPLACTPTNPCELSAGASTVQTNTTTYFAPTTFGDEWQLAPGFPAPATARVPRTNFTTACMTAPRTVTDPMQIAGCTSSTPCQITASTLDDSVGLAPDQDNWFSNAIAPYYRMASGANVQFNAVPSSSTTVNGVWDVIKPVAGCATSLTLTGNEDLTAFGASDMCSAARPCQLTFQAERCLDVSGAGPPYPVRACPGPTESDSLVQRRCVYSAVRTRYTPPFIGECVYTRMQYRYERPTCTYTARQWTASLPACMEPAPGACNFRISRYQFRFPDPYTYCRVVGEQVPFTGNAPASYDYRYETKGGEFMGTVTVNPTRPGLATAIQNKLQERNFCELNPPQYSDFASACPGTVDSSNAASFAMLTECGTGGRSCRLRWRRNISTFPLGRISYSLAGPDYELYDLSAPKCLAPDRPLGETTTPAATSLLTGADTVGLLQINQNAQNYFGGGWTTYQSGWKLNTSLGGIYTLYARSFPMQAGGEHIRVGARLCVNPSSPATCVTAPTLTTTVPTGGTEVLAWRFNLPGNTTYDIQFNFENDYYDSATGADRNWRIRGTSGAVDIVDNRSVWIEKLPDDFCRGTGLNAVQVRVRSDWYDPSLTNPVAPSSNIPYATSTNNQSRKTSGWSRREDGGTGDLFVPIEVGSTAMPKLTTALRRCSRPADLTTPTDGGFCWSDQRTCGPGGNESCYDTSITSGMTDFTPLYGSLTNARDFLREELLNDNGSEWECRDYYVLLITDGLESTPRNYNNSDLIAAVNALRGLDAGTRSKDVKTFVVGFGAGLTGGTDAGQLDLMARAGGTAMRRTGSTYAFDLAGGYALSAVSANELTDSLSIVLSNITAGRFSRSRPSLTTDGQRLYQSYFDRGASDGGTQRELKGNLIALRLDISGNISGTPEWEWRDKVDRQGPGTPNSPSVPATRQFYTWIPHTDGGFSGRQNFEPGNSTVTSYIDTVAGSPSSPGADVVRFVRNDGMGSNAAESYGSGLLRRSSRAGAVAFSGPIAVGASPFPQDYGGASAEPSFSAYGTFKTAFQNRPMRVIIGGWDGLVRGVMDRTSTGADCTPESSATCLNGAEAWALVPPAALTRLYDVRHNELGRVDGPTAVADVCWTSTNNAAECTASDWRTVMVTSLRQGGEEIAAFDITDGGVPSLLWRFNDRTDLVDGTNDDLGETYAPPIVGRVSVDGNKKWVGFFGGGLGPGDEGDGIYVLDMQNGQPRVKGGSEGITKWVGPADDEDIVGRPALYKRTGLPDVETAFYGTLRGTLWAQRTWDTSDPEDDWEPTRFYDPWDNMSREDVNGDDAIVQYVDKTTGDRLSTGCRMELGRGGSPNAPFNNSSHPAYLNNCSTLGTRRPFFNRPRVTSVFDSSRSQPDIFIGTGDVNNLNSNPDPGNPERNFFFAIHDRTFPLGTAPSFGTNGANRAGQTMWVYMFDRNEKVISEPAFVGGSVVVATYLQPNLSCFGLGDSYLYAFDPRTGEPRRSLEDPSAPGSFVSVVRLQGAGVLSDLVAANGRVYYARGDGRAASTNVRPVGISGRVQGWRRVR